MPSRRVRVWLAAAVLAAPTAIAVLAAAPAHAVCTIPGGGNYPVLTGALLISGTPGPRAALTASGNGFDPGSSVCVEVESNPVQLATATVARSGGFTSSLRLPDLSPGQQIMRAIGTTENGSTLILTTAFTVGSGLPSTGLKIVRWLLFVAGVIWLSVLLVRGNRARRRVAVARGD